MQVASLMLVLMCSCSYKYAGRDLHVSTSPCVDGTIVNIDYHGCESMYFGNDQREDVIKVRCVSSSENNMWTRSSFYFVKLDTDMSTSSMRLFCRDDYAIGYVSNNPREKIRVQN